MSLYTILFQVDYTGGFQNFSIPKFGQKFVGEVANPGNILLWHRRRAANPTKSTLPIIIYTVPAVHCQYNKFEYRVTVA